MRKIVTVLSLAAFLISDIVELAKYGVTVIPVVLSVLCVAALVLNVYSIVTGREI